MLFLDIITQIGILSGILGIIFSIIRFYKLISKPIEENALFTREVSAKMDEHIKASYISNEKIDKIAESVNRTDEKLNSHMENSKEFRFDISAKTDSNMHTLNKVMEEMAAIDSRMDNLEKGGKG